MNDELIHAMAVLSALEQKAFSANNREVANAANEAWEKLFFAMQTEGDDN